MASLKDEIKIKEQELELNVQRTRLNLAQIVAQFSPWKRKLILICLIAVVPVYIGTRIAAGQIVQHSLAKSQLTVHPSFLTPQAIRTSSVTVLPVTDNRYAAYAQVTNDNLDLSATDIQYRFVFTDSNGLTVATSSGKLFLLPDEKKYLVVPRVDAKAVSAAALELSNVSWQKRLQTPQISLRPDIPALTDESDPAALAAQGVVFNDSPYSLGQVHLTILLYNKAGKIIGVNTRDEFSLRPGERRAYKVTWPNLSSSEVTRSSVQAETNTLDPSNLRSAQ